MSNSLGVIIHDSNIYGTKSGYFPALNAITLYTTIRGICADAGYHGTFVDEIWDNFQILVDISQQIALKQ